MTKTQLQYFVKEQKVLATSAFGDPAVRNYFLTALVGGAISSIALAQAYGRLTKSDKDSAPGTLVKTAIFALVSGGVTIVYRLNQAKKAQELIAVVETDPDVVEAILAEDPSDSSSEI